MTIILNILIMLDWKLGGNEIFGYDDTFGAILSIVLFGIGCNIVIIIIDSINILRKDLYEDTGQLLFTVPKSSYSILLSKMLTTVIELLLFGLLFTTLMISIIVAEGTNFESVKVMLQVLGENIGIVLQALFAILIDIMNFLVTIYFSLVLTKSLLKDKKYSGITAFGIFLLLSIFMGKINSWLFRYMPYSSDLGMSLRYGEFVLELPISAGESIAIILFNLCLFIILFFLTGYLLEHKTDI